MYRFDSTIHENAVAQYEKKSSEKIEECEKKEITCIARDRVEERAAAAAAATAVKVTGMQRGPQEVR